MNDKVIKVDMLARVEGEGAFKVVVRDGEIVGTEFRIFEPPRFFEAFLQGRDHMEAPDITARICGICPVAYQMSSVHAMEMALGITVDGPLRDLRRLLYCGEWIESHILHAAMLHAPDFLGYAGAIEMANDGHGDAVKLALEYKKAGNAIVTFVGGREIHPINVRVGGFYKVPRKTDFAPLREQLLKARDLAEKFVDWTASFTFPDKERDYTMVSLSHPDEYPMNEGRVVSSKGLDIDVTDWPAHFREEHVAHSNALQGFMVDGSSYLCGPVPRFNNAYDLLSDRAKAAAERVGLPRDNRNPYRSITVRAIEGLYAVDEALRIIDAYEEPDAPFVAYEPRAGVGMAATEAPRGLLFHRYELNDDGSIKTALIVPPTSQNQPSIEEDLQSFIGDILDQPDEDILLLCEQTIRNYDPCISCATHFLELDIDRG
ncbi:Ni/Fe hydrogenase subunit alpha [Aliiroseovarius subalbicans]|uniref:Ni/Fe hydrogenase subunit alpha n=1 Tax=Aliiroseovarius subalbicans TaxID=2925840 RepID=UPI001F58B94C|nr:Ni/Fe hydrogenase subunit alpha [Aliiroseovarius subalbicans]MCI2397804.1 Ni/Fe hydrogenase subunit alpha [Aliiroseovarius subalbicans]